MALLPLTKPIKAMKTVSRRLTIDVTERTNQRKNDNELGDTHKAIHYADPRQLKKYNRGKRESS
jgi:hypothetical protein